MIDDLECVTTAAMKDEDPDKGNKNEQRREKAD